MEIKKDHLNFAVGPVPMDPSLLERGADPIPYFRTADFSAVMKENERLICSFVGAPPDSRALFLTGSGTAAMEAAVINCFTKKDKLLVVKGGSFGARFCEICRVYGIEHTPITLSAGTPLTAQDLAAFAGQGYTGFLVNMGETSTGVLYDMALIGAFCRREGLRLVVDAISTFMADPLDMAALGADVVLTGSQKALAVDPGVSIVVLSPQGVQAVRANTPACYYLDLKAALADGERGQTPFTPAVGILLRLNLRLCGIAEEGFDTVLRKTAALAADFRSRLSPYPFCVATSTPSNAVTPLTPTDPSLSAYAVFERLKEDYGIIVCPNGGALRDTLFRVGHIGYHTTADHDRLFAAFDDLMARGFFGRTVTR